MLKRGLLLSFILGLLCYPFALSAQEDNTDDENEAELNAFGYPNKELVTVIESNEKAPLKGESADMPDCNDSKLLKQLRTNLMPYMDESDKTIRNQRKMRILLKNIKNFIELNSSEVNPKNDKPAANRLIEIKINSRKNNEDIKICKMSNHAVDLNFYTIMYYVEDKLVVELINFNNKSPSFVFEK